MIRRSIPAALATATLMLAASCSSGESVPRASSPTLVAEPPAAVEQAAASESTAASDGPASEPTVASANAAADATGDGELDNAESSEGDDQAAFSVEYVQAESLGLAPSVVVDATDRTLALDRLRYTAIASSVVEALGLEGESIREGDFEVGRGLGMSRVLVGQGLDPELTGVIFDAVAQERGVPDGVSAEEFDEAFDMTLDAMLTDGLHYRLIDGVYWQRLPNGPDDFVWLGFPVDAFIAQAGVDPVALFDGGTYLALLSGPEFSVLGQVAEIGSGWTRWRVEVGADRAGPLSAGSGTVQRLFDAGYAGAPDLQLPATVDVDAEGLVRRIRVDVSDWWLRGYEETGIPVDELSVVLSVSLRPIADLDVELPCDKPEVDTSEGVELLVCETGS